MRKHLRKAKLIYQMDELGEQVFEFESTDPHLYVTEFLTKNPPGATVRAINLFVSGCNYVTSNRSFSWEAYNKAVADKRWKDEYFQRTGKAWRERTGQTEEAPHRDPIVDVEAVDLTPDQCRALLGVGRDVSPRELKVAHRKAVKMNHPDKVAAMSVEFVQLAERRTKQINQAFEKLLAACR